MKAKASWQRPKSGFGIEWPCHLDGFVQRRISFGQ